MSRGLQKHFKAADQMMLRVGCGLFVFSLCLAPVYGTWLTAILLGGTILGGQAAMAYYAPGSVLSRLASGVAMMSFTALHIHQAGGMLEMHFGVFVLLAILLIYRDWLPIAAAATTTAVHHAAFYVLQSNGAEVWLLPTVENGIWIVGLHAGYVVVESILLIFMAQKQKQEFLQASELMQATEDIVSSGQLDLTIRTSGSTELLNMFNNFTESVASLSQSVKSSAESIGSDGEALQEVMTGMVEATNRQSDESKQIAERINELSRLVADASNNVTEVAGNAKLADERAAKGAEVGESSRQVIQTLAIQIASAKEIIEALNERSAAISSVMDVIRNIADQTNLLALNAAIEAARAGEQGRGFAVVADEVRTLAQRTQDSTQEIDQMVEALQQGSASSVEAITSSEMHVSKCLEKTDVSQELLNEIRQDVAALTALSDTIEGQTKAQLAAVDKINGWTNQLASESAAAVGRVEQAGAAGKRLRQLAQSLTDEASRFKLS
ncbi:MAG: methyl-accepting chemotaxis protein [Pseudomonadales bacterium]